MSTHTCFLKHEAVQFAVEEFRGLRISQIVSHDAGTGTRTGAGDDPQSHFCDISKKEKKEKKEEEEEEEEEFVEDVKSVSYRVLN